MLPQTGILKFFEERAAAQQWFRQEPEHSSGSIPVANTRMFSSRVTQPQRQNLAGKVFGGFLIRQAFELAIANARVFAACFGGGSCSQASYDDLRFYNKQISSPPIPPMHSSKLRT